MEQGFGVCKRKVQGFEKGCSAFSKGTRGVPSLGAFFQSESRSSFTVRAAFRRGLRLRLRHNASPVPGPMGTSFAVFWNACQWFGVCFLFFHSFAQCADWVDPVVPFGDYRIWGICGSPVSGFPRNDSGDRHFLFFMEGRAFWPPPVGVDLYTGRCSHRSAALAVCGALFPVFQPYGESQFFLPTRWAGFEIVFLRFAFVLQLFRRDLFIGQPVGVGVFPICLRKEGGNKPWAVQAIITPCSATI